MARATVDMAGVRRQRWWEVPLCLACMLAALMLLALFQARAAAARLEAECATHGLHWSHAGEWMPPADRVDDEAVECSGPSGAELSFPNGARAVRPVSYDMSGA